MKMNYNTQKSPNLKRFFTWNILGNYFHRFIGYNLPNLEKFLSREKNLSNTKFRRLLKKHEKKIKKDGYIIDKINNTTSIIKKNGLSIRYFKSNNVKELELNSVLQILDLSKKILTGPII